ncbi:PucR family transcriptional regulator [Streptomyces sp. SCL15-4]|uniref:PucR family transcriptional regulator n=1 Tax=Streptomyces sp. SCL15-4 TaxID=2967221 RepID=UPI0029672830|nr:helix-turn-helix domain-containing protein [Streptomyces sp. SCL15-4]
MTEARDHAEWEAAGGPRVTLERLLSVVGSGALELDTAPGGPAVAVGGATVLDVLAPEIRPRELVLAVGVAAGSAQAVDVVRRAGAAGACGVVFGPERPEGSLGALRSAAHEAGTAVLFRTWYRWEELVAVLRAGLAAAGVPPLPAARGLVLGDLDGLADAVAALVGGSVTIEDTESRVLAYSSTEENVDEMRRLTILGRRVPAWRVAAMRDAGFFRALWTTDDVLHRRAQGDNPERLVCAVRAGGEVLGSVWVAAVAGRPLSPNAAEALRAASRAAAPHLLHHRTRGADSRLVEDAARALLEERGSAEVLAERAALPAREPCAVLAVGAGAGAAGPEPAGEASRMYALLALHCAALGHRIVVVPAGGRALVLVSALDRDADRAREQVTALGTALATRLTAATGAPVRAGLGEVVPALARAARSRRSAEQALKALTRTGGARTVAWVEDVADTIGVLQVLEALREAELPPGTSVARLAAFDAEHAGSRLVETLRAYLDHFGDVPAAARSLSLHPNSMRYRLGRITAVSGLDLASPDARLLAQLQLRLALGDPEQGRGGGA